MLQRIHGYIPRVLAWLAEVMVSCHYLLGGRCVMGSDHRLMSVITQEFLNSWLNQIIEDIEIIHSWLSTSQTFLALFNVVFKKNIWKNSKKINIIQLFGSLFQVILNFQKQIEIFVSRSVQCIKGPYLNNQTSIPNS